MKKFLLLVIVCLSFITSVFAEKLTVIQVTDIHYTQDNQEPLKSFITRVNNLKDIDLLFFTGDNTDKSNENDLKHFLSETENIKIPYYILLGNHDAYKISGIAKEDYMEWVKLYNKNQKSLSPNFTLYPKKGFAIVCLDGATPLAPSSHGFFNQNTLTYFEKMLDKNKNKKVLVFQHFPIIPPREHYAHTVLEPQKYLDILNTHNNVALVASGHYHHPNLQIDENGVYHISTASLGKNRTFKKIEIYYEKKLFSPPKIKEIKLTDLSI